MKLLFCILAALGVATASYTNVGCIVGCKCKEDVTLSKKLKIADCDSPIYLSNNTFSKAMKKVFTIHFDNVHIIRIEKDAFNSFDNLEAVIIEDSNIESIHRSAFDLQQLSTIKFTRTRFLELPNFTTESLEELVFNDCQLTKIPDLELPSLTLLSLADNQLEKIDKMAFSKLDSLTELNLSNNSISSFPPSIFIRNADLNTLNLDNNPLESFVLSNISNLEMLSLKSCKLSTFDRSASRNLDLVSYLDLSYNQISVLPLDAFSGMKELAYIDLSHNQLIELDDDIFLDNGKLNRITLDNNNFQKLPKFQTTDEVFQVYSFTCDNCKLQSVNDSFKYMPGIVTLSLANNKILNFDGVLSNIHDLKELSLANNSITSIGANLFINNSKLEVLNLSGNTITSLDPVVFSNMSQLKKLDASNNGLVQLWSNHNAILPALQQLIISRNQFTKITVDDLKVTPELKLIDLQSNPLKCSQDLHDIIVYLVKNSIYPIEGANKLRTHEALMTVDATYLDTSDIQQMWKQLAFKQCFPQSIESIFDEDEFDVESNKYKISSTIKYDDLVNYDDDDDFYEDFADEDQTEKLEIEYDEETTSDDPNMIVSSFVLNGRNITLARASYILSITSVFVLTALIVLTLAVAITLFCLKRNGTLNMNSGNIPRLKIPLWHTNPTQKKHSGSVYRHLSEDLTGSRTSIINKYEFKQTPLVHNAQ